MMTRFVGIDPASETGFVALDPQGNILVAKALTGVGTTDPMRISTLLDEIRGHLRRDDRVCIEGFSYGSKGRGVSFQYGLGWLIRNMMYKGLIYPYKDVPPSSLKKFTGAKGNAGKDDVAAAAMQKWGYENSNNNIVDAYVLAQISLENYKLGVIAK